MNSAHKANRAAKRLRRAARQLAGVENSLTIALNKDDANGGATDLSSLLKKRNQLKQLIKTKAYGNQTSHH